MLKCQAKAKEADKLLRHSTATKATGGYNARVRDQDMVKLLVFKADENRLIFKLET